MSRARKEGTAVWPGRRLAGLTCILCLLACQDEEVGLLPTAALSPTAAVTIGPRFNIVGHWEGTTEQSRRVAFDVTSAGELKNGRFNLHHDCYPGVLRMTIDGYEAPVSGGTFTASLIWRIDDRGLIYAGKLTVSGRFESDFFVRGGFVNSLTRKPSNDGLGQCVSIHGAWEASKE